MKTIKRQFGDFGENIACIFLISRGYKIIETNFFTKFGEIDIICSKFNILFNRTELFFVEVKTRLKSEYYFYPENAVNYSKKLKIEKVAQIFLDKRYIFNRFYSFSVIAIIIDNITKKANIKFFEKI